jgi:uncharacterized membrane protein YdjX (TVP38/TMEM64 family)
MQADGPRLTLRRAAPLMAVALGAVLGLWLFGDLLRLETLRDNREALLAWREHNLPAAALAYFAAYAAIVLISLPGAAAMTMAGGFLFGPLAGASLAVVAATLGATGIFLAARHGLGGALSARLRARAGGEGMLAEIGAGLRENEASCLLVMRLVPAVPFFVANLAPALLGARLRVYVLTTFFGIMPATAIYASIGAGLAEVLERGERPDPGVLLSPALLWPLLALAALASLPILVRALRRRRSRR